MWSPAPARFKIAVVDAAWPDASASAPGSPTAVSGAPSSAATRASTTAWVGFMIRV